MSLARVWTPTNNKSSGGTKRLLVIHSMEGFTGPNGAYDCATYFQKSSAGASSQVCIDNNRGTIWEGVTRVYGSWTQCNFNSVSISCEQSGYASWSRDYWLSARNNQLWNIAEWLAEESAITGIPLVDLSASQAQSSSWGVCYHSELGSAGCGHSDPGAGWPFDVVLQRARDFLTGGAPPVPVKPEKKLEEDMALEFAAGDPVKAVSFTGACYRTMGIMCHSGDIKLGDPPRVILRCNFRRENGSTYEQKLYLEPGKTKAVIDISDAGGMCAQREDENTVVIIPNFELK